MREVLQNANPEEFFLIEERNKNRHIELKKLRALQKKPEMLKNYRLITSRGEAVDLESNFERFSSALKSPVYVAFVRHPVSWWLSLWRYRQTVGWDMENDIDIKCCSADYNSFIEKVLCNKPGACSRIFRQFVETGTSSDQFVGRYENLFNDLLFILEKSGVEFNKSYLTKMKDVRLNASTGEIPELLSELSEALLKSEFNIISQFYSLDLIEYTEPPLQISLQASR